MPHQGEDESDAGGLLAGFKASIGSRDWTVETLLSQMRKGRIDLDPSFQRRNAWLDNRKSKLLESIMLGFPIPQIVLAEKRDAPGYFFVLDGKQRLLALRQFFADPDDPRDAHFVPLRLTGLEVLTELNRKDVDSLAESYPEWLARIENHSIRTVALSDWSSENLLLSLFLRLNTGSVALSPQELRQALIPGEFVKWLDQASGDLQGLRRLLNNEHPDRRMIDAELLLRHLSFASSPYRYSGNLKVFLDETSRFFNQNWEKHVDLATQEASDYNEALNTGLEMWGTSFARKWVPDPARGAARFERALNRALLDVQAYSLKFPNVRSAVQADPYGVLDRFKSACESDTFVRSISTTTKTAEAFITRHRVWSQVLSESVQAGYPMPEPLKRS
ncbi:hypothetical protein BJN44_12520 [Tessaracoccus sp. ZS01]|nr:hypothetical protein BJN44_12520 [Tessaracoccus sp. ZS01]